MWTFFSLACGATPVWRSLCEIYILLFYTLYGYCDSAYNIIYIQKYLPSERWSSIECLWRDLPTRLFVLSSEVRPADAFASKTSFTCTYTYISFSNREFGDRIPTSPPKDLWSWPSTAHTCTFSTRVSFLWYLSRRSSKDRSGRTEHFLKYCR